MQKRKIFEYPLLTNRLVFVDGLTRTGKAMLNQLLLGFDNLSSIQFITVIEQLLPMYAHNKISKEAISSYMRLYLNENFYNYKLSRNLNFRFDDLTSIHNSNNSVDIYKNLNKEDGDKVIEEVLEESTIFQFQTHDLMTHYRKFLDLGIEANIIELFRNPVDTIHSWYFRGWGNRFDNEDPRNVTTLFKYNNNTIPHYVVGNEEKYILLNEMEKCVFMHNLLLKKSIEEYKKLDDNKKGVILLLKYEELLTEPDIQIKKISKFLDVKETSFMPKTKLIANVPRFIDITKRKIKLEFIKKHINGELWDELVELINLYYDFYELKG